MIVVALVYLLLFFAEKIWPLRQNSSRKFNQLTINISFTTIMFAIAALSVSPVSNFMLEQTRQYQFGLLALLQLSPTLKFILSFLLLDLTFYYWHRLNHEVPLLWRFHNVHHIDPDLDVSTSFRFHLVEILYSTAFRILQVFVLGIAPLSYAVYGTIFMCATMFHHSNIRLPIGLERVLTKIIVTPRMHGIHHSAVKSETNSNYSVIFRWWDRLHKTLVLNVPQRSINIGVPAYQKPEDNRLWNLLKMPFTTQRQYWIFEDKSSPQSNQRQDVKVTSMME